jgi:subtilisin family serine protease/subtilisin-like proprotein convertase family protein
MNKEAVIMLFPSDSPSGGRLSYRLHRRQGLRASVRRRWWRPTAEHVGVAILFTLCAIGGTAVGEANSEQTHLLGEGACRRLFTLALDELSMRTEAGREVMKCDPQPSAAALGERAIAVSRVDGKERDLVLYEAGKDRTQYTRRILTRKVLVQLAPDADVTRLARDLGAKDCMEVPYAPGFVIVECAGPGDSLRLAQELGARPETRAAHPMLALQLQKTWLPDDPFFNGQWHLQNSGQGGGTPGIDLNLVEAWNTYRGDGVAIGIIDDGMQTAHPDLFDNADRTIDHDWNGDDSNPSPVTANDNHGTACAGCAAARGDNGEGVCGVAPRATVVGMRLIAAPSSDDEEAEAFLWHKHDIHVKSCSWKRSARFGGPRPLAANALREAAETGRGGRGTITVFSAGNDDSEDVNLNGFANSIYTVCVGAIGDDGLPSSYSQPGACVTVCGPSSGGASDITTTDRTGNDGYNRSSATGDLSDRSYSKGFNGTSASTPMVAGCVALMLQANPELGWRDVQEILMRTARKVNVDDQSDPNWVANGCGYTFNRSVGAGLADAGAALEMAQSWPNLGTQRVAVVETNVSLVLSSRDQQRGSFDLPVLSESIRVEHVRLTVGTTLEQGDIPILPFFPTVRLTSPAGTESRMLANTAAGLEEDFEWQMTSLRHWGELSTGTWRVTLGNVGGFGTTTVHRIQLELLGATPTNRPPVMQPVDDTVVAIGSPIAVDVTARDGIDGDPITLSVSNAPPWTMFAPGPGGGVAGGQLLGRSSETGRFPIVFYAADKDGFDRRTAWIRVHNTVSVVNENFNAWPSTGWTVVTEPDSVCEWELESWGFIGSGDRPTVEFFGSPSEDEPIDTQLRSPTLDFSAFSAGSFSMLFESGLTFLDPGVDAEVDLSLNGASGPWTTVHTAQRSDENVRVPLPSLAGESNVMLRFRAHGSGWTLDWEIDNLEITVEESPQTDGDGDGMPNWWERLYFGGATNANYLADSDGDGVNDGDEQKCGTDPRDRDSVLALTGIEPSGAGQVRLTWASAYGRRYAVGLAPSLPAAFTAVDSDLTATPPLNTHTVTGTTSSASLYRIIVQ